MKINLFRKGQAALEFLTTYGWAFLVILIMVGTLAYFGILRPSKILPDRCNIGPEFECVDYQISGADTLRLRLKNAVGETVAVQSISLGSESTIQYTCTLSPTTPLPTSWKTGNVTDFLWTTCNSVAAGFARGEKAKVLMSVRYYSVTSGSNYAKEVNGEIFSTVI